MTERTVSLGLAATQPQVNASGSHQRIEQVRPEALLERIERLPFDRQLLVDFDGLLCRHHLIEKFLTTLKPLFWVAIILQCLDMLRYGLLLQRDASDRHLRRLQWTMWLQPNAKAKWQTYVQAMPESQFNLALYRHLKLFHKGRFKLYSSAPDWLLAPVQQRLQAIVGQRPESLSVAHVAALDVKPEAQHVVISSTAKLPSQLQQVAAQLVCHDVKSLGLEAGQSPMLPLVYTKKVKRPNESYFTRAVIGHDYLTLLLVFALASPQPLFCAASLFLFVMAYFSAYEIGYFENDTLGMRFEAKPKVSLNYQLFAQYFKPVVAWAFALLIAIPAALLATQISNLAMPTIAYGQWSEWWKVWLLFVAFMAGVRLVFAWFNRIHEKGRIVPMLILQLARTSGYLVLFSTSLIGVLFCLSHGLSKWFPYVVYRFGGSRKGMPNHLINMLLLALMLMSLVIGQADSLAELLSIHGLIIFAYVALRTLKDVWSFRQQLAFVREINPQ